ncbi:MAG: bifunctional 4-hydroxy-2-oxoglutarate aldolase/2-dehydro-3-deoxy-phosphogluconate aldolase [Bacteroidota bacterium]
MNEHAVNTRIKETGIIAIIRGAFDEAQVLEIAETLTKGGVEAIEVTLNSTDALARISKLRETLATSAVIGAGTVRTALQAQQAIDAGAQFLVSPNLDLESVAVAKAAGIPHLPGVFTGSEAQTAHAAGCKMVKLFPAHMLGPAYLKALRAPLDDIGFVPTGGISAHNVGDYIKAGAVAVGVGSALVQGADMDRDELLSRAQRMRTVVDIARRH